LLFFVSQVRGQLVQLQQTILTVIPTGVIEEGLVQQARRLAKITLVRDGRSFSGVSAHGVLLF
jgi:hypothetical protein